MEGECPDHGASPAPETEDTYKKKKKNENDNDDDDDHLNKDAYKKLVMFIIGSLQLTVTWCKNRHVETQETHWDETNKELTSIKMVISFVCLVPVRLLRLNMAVFVPCNCKLQRAYNDG